VLLPIRLIVTVDKVLAPTNDISNYCTVFNLHLYYLNGIIINEMITGKNFSVPGSILVASVTINAEPPSFGAK
jgi:hypothetical protein